MNVANFASAAQKYAPVPGYNQAAYRSVIASPTQSSPAYTTAYIQPTGISPVKVKATLTIHPLLTAYMAFL